MYEIRCAILSALAALAMFTATTVHAQQVAPVTGDELSPPAPPPVAATPTHATPAPPPEPAPNPLYPAMARPPYAQPYSPASPQNPRILGYRQTSRNPPTVWWTGLGLFLAGYVLDFAILTPIANAVSYDRDGADEEDAWAWSLIPIAGPIIQLGVGAPHPAIPIATGLMQIGGLVMFIIGLTTEETTHIPIYEGSPDDPNMLRVGLDAAQVDGGGELRVSLTHL